MISIDSDGPRIMSAFSTLGCADLELEEALGLAARYGVEMPITEQMDAILHHGKSPNEAIRELMARPGRDE